MATQMFTLCLLTIVLAGVVCRPHTRFLDYDCQREHNCTDEQNNPICCTDGNTYPSRCHIDRMNQIKVCDLGDFNPVEFVHHGPCKKD